jgi:hypothetical protein
MCFLFSFLQMTRQGRSPLDPREHGVQATDHEVMGLPGPAAARRAQEPAGRAGRDYRHNRHRRHGRVAVLRRRRPRSATGQVEGPLLQVLQVQQVGRETLFVTLYMIMSRVVDTDLHATIMHFYFHQQDHRRMGLRRSGWLLAPPG